MKVTECEKDLIEALRNYKKCFANAPTFWIVIQDLIQDVMNKENEQIEEEIGNE